LRTPPDRTSCADAAALVNVSPRLVQYALRVLRRGVPELIAAVESGGMAVSTAANLARLPHAGQTQALAQGAPAAAAQARQFRRAPSGKSPVPASFGLYPDHAPDGDPIVLLWVGANAAAGAIETLQNRGFRYSG